MHILWQRNGRMIAEADGNPNSAMLTPQLFKFVLKIKNGHIKSQLS
jgi:hypothetical protein